MNQANADPRRVLDTVGKVLVPLRSLNPGQQCAMRHADKKYWYPYIIVAHDHMIAQYDKKIMPCPMRTVVKIELASWDVRSDQMVYRIDPISENLRGADKGIII